jgi:DNA-directed RNA polymerase subunit beta'
MSLPTTAKTLILPVDKERKSFDFDALRLRLASPEEILSWSHGEVLYPETINYRTQKPERDGLFCEKIFGPVKDFECACGKYKKVRYRGIVCDRCGVEVTRSLVRRERMGHIKLAAPVTHIWFLRGVPTKIGLLLDLSIQNLEKVVYFANFIITEVNEDLKRETLDKLNQEFKIKKKKLAEEFKKGTDDYNNGLKDLTEEWQRVKKEIESIVEKRLLTEFEYHELSRRFGHLFKANIGAEAIYQMLAKIDLAELIKNLEKEKRKTTNPLKKNKIVQRLKVVKNFFINKLRPEWMVLTVLPVIPPDLRPMVQLDGGRFASSDLNDLYRRVINRNNRLKRLQELHSPEVILRNEKRMLQEAVDALLDNEMRSGKTVLASTGQPRPLKSLADILKGKQGRFRQNLLGKRVDYSARSVIVVNPNLKLHQCGIPKIMAVELFRPFIVRELIKREIVHNVRSANRFINSGAKEVWDILEEVSKESWVFLNRAPTLHRLSIQAFQPVLVEGKAIQIHPLICPAFNADFDGDQMAVHLPILEQAKEEAKEIIASVRNLLKPATGEPINSPDKDMVWGAYWLTMIKEPEGQLKNFASVEEAILAYETGKVSLQEKIRVKINETLKETTVGRLIFNSVLPAGLYQADQQVDKKVMKSLVKRSLELYGQERTVQLLDDLKEISLKYLTISGLSWGMDDLPPVPGKEKIIAEADERINEIRKQYEAGLLAEDERYQKNIEVWMRAKDQIADLCRKVLSPYSSVLSMVESGARGSWTQLTQMLGMKGNVASPSGQLIELPIRSNYQEGFNVLEYFISTHGARKGIADTALRTASAGYLTRRLVDVAQEVIVTEDDCGDSEGFTVTQEECKELGEDISERILGRVVLDKIVDPQTKKTIIKPGELVTFEKAREIAKINLSSVRIRSVLTCKAKRGVCVKCYGWDLGYNRLVKMGEAVGIVAAQSIGEPGTQLTLRTFHTGGVAGRDITQGLPRVQELFEVRPPKRKAFMAYHDGRVEIEEGPPTKIRIKYEGEFTETYPVFEDEGWAIKVKDGDLVKRGDLLAVNEKRKIVAKNNGRVVLEGEILKLIYSGEGVEEYELAPGYVCWVKNGQMVKAGQQLTDGSLDLRELYQLRGKEETARYILKEIQYIYSLQGQKLNDKHIEIIIRQMFSRCLVEDGGETDLLPGEIVPRAYFDECNKQALRLKQKPAKGRELLLGITKAALATDSFLAAASFQETSRVLINAAITGRLDRLYGLKENVIIGRLIPVGTGFKPRNEQT